MDRYLKNFNSFGFSRPKPFFLCKNNPNLSLLIFRFRVNILKKVEFQNNKMEAMLKASTKFGEKSGSCH
jgi:hypothetical protein